jgi:hypothetical protein
MKKWGYLLVFLSLLTRCGDVSLVNSLSVAHLRKEVFESYGGDETVVSVSEEGVLSVTMVNSICNERSPQYKQNAAYEIGKMALQVMDAPTIKRGVVNFQIRRTDGKNFDIKSIAYNMALDSLRKGNKQ